MTESRNISCELRIAVHCQDLDRPLSIPQLFFLSNDLKSKVRTIVSACILQYHGAPLLLVDILSYMNMTFTLCFTVECVLKLIAFGPGVNSSKSDEGPSSLNVRPYYP